MIIELSNKLRGVTHVKLTIAGRKFDIWCRDGDSYLGSLEAIKARSAEASAFSNTCINILGNLQITGSCCALDVGANVGITSLVLPWHFKDSILWREQEFLASGGKFIFPFPEIEII